MLAEAIRRDGLHLTPAPANGFLDEYDGGEVGLDAFRHEGLGGRTALREHARQLRRLFDDCAETGVLCVPEHRYLDAPRGAAQHPEPE
jgi:hypothetical protein